MISASPVNREGLCPRLAGSIILTALGIGRLRQVPLVSSLIGVTAMNIDRAVFAFAGVMILLSVMLTQFVSPWFVLLTVFVGLNLLQSAFTGFCPAAMIFRKLGLTPGCAFQ